MRNPSANRPVLLARNHRLLACRSRRWFDVRTSLPNFPTESCIAPTADLSAFAGCSAIPLNVLKSIIGLCRMFHYPDLPGNLHDRPTGNPPHTYPDELVKTHYYTLYLIIVLTRLWQTMPQKPSHGTSFPRIDIRLSCQRVLTSLKGD